MSQSGYWADKPRGYAQAAAGAIDAATFISSLTFTPPGENAQAGIPKGTQLLLISPGAQAIRWRDDGIAPTSTVGYPLAAGAELRYTGAIASLQVISQVAGAVLNVVAYG
jgi:hypothetical protein